MRDDIENGLTRFIKNARKEAQGWNYKFHDFVQDVADFAALAIRNPRLAFPIFGAITGIVASAFSPVEAMAAGANFDSMSSDRGSRNSLLLGANELAAMGLTADMSSGLSKIGPNVPEYAGKESGIIAENWGLPADNQIQNAWLIHNPIDSKSDTVQQIASDAAAVIRNSYPGLDVRGSDMHVLHLVGEKTDGDVDNLEASAVMIPYTIVTGTDGKPYMISVFDVQASADLTDNKLVGYGRGLPAIAVPIASEQVGGETRIGPRTLSTGEVNHLLVANEKGLYFEGLDGQRIFVAGNVDAIGGHLASLVPVNLPRQEVTPTAVPDVALTATQVVDATPTEVVSTSEFNQLAPETMGCLKKDMCLGLEAKDGAALYTQFLDALAHSYENKQWMGNIKDAEQLRAFLKTSMHPDPVTGEMRPYWMPLERNGQNIRLLRGNRKGSYNTGVFLDNNPGIEAAGGFFLNDIAFVAASKKEIDANAGGIADWLQKVEVQNGKHVLIQVGSGSEEVWGFAVVDGQAVFIAFNKNAPLDDFDHPENLLGQTDAAANGRILSAMWELYTRVHFQYANDRSNNDLSMYKTEPDSTKWVNAAMCVEGNGMRCSAHPPSYFGGDDALFVPTQE